jgi:dissimilatory sulfite reductase (desulfoviridin) alpha/beta subunit
MATSERESVMGKQHNWIVQICDHHAVTFNAQYWAFELIKDALKQKSKCGACKLDMPINIKKVDIILEEGDY